MFYEIAQTVVSLSFILAALVTVATFATLYVVAAPYFERGDLQKRMRAVSTEREQIRLRERAKLNLDSGSKSDAKSTLRNQDNKSVKNIVERLNLREALVDQNTVNKLRAAGFRSQNALNTFLFARLVLPFIFLLLGAFWVFALDHLATHPLPFRLFFVVLVGYLGFYTPNIFISNRTSKRQASIRQSWPDALDLMLICVESGVSIEAAMRRVADEIATQSAELAEEFVLTTAELSYLPDRRMAFENLSNRTPLESVKATTQALVQAERYGTPVAQALRVLAQESRDHRMNEAEKKAAALPPKLTVPMIVFFLPVLMAVILGPAGIRVADQMSGQQHSDTSH